MSQVSTNRIIVAVGVVGSAREGFSPSLRDRLLNLIIHVLADLLQGALDALQIIVSDSPAAAVLRVILTVHKDCPPIFYLAFIALEAIVVNAHAAALGGIVVHGILRFADAADGLFYIPISLLIQLYGQPVRISEKKEPFAGIFVDSNSLVLNAGIVEPVHGVG